MCFIVRTFTIPSGDLDGPGARCTASTSPPCGFGTTGTQNSGPCSCVGSVLCWEEVQSLPCPFAVKGAVPQMGSSVLGGSTLQLPGQLKPLLWAKWGSQMHPHPECCPYSTSQVSQALHLALPFPWQLCLKAER